MINIIHLLLLSVLFRSNIVSAQNFISSNSSSAVSTFNVESSSSSSILTSSSSSFSSSIPTSSSLSSSSSILTKLIIKYTNKHIGNIFVAPSNTSSSFNLFSTSINTNVSSSSSFLETSSSSSTLIPTTHNISTLPVTSTSKSSFTSSSISSSSSESRGSTSFSTSSVTPTTSASLSTYTSDGQVLVTQVFMTLTSTHTSFSTKPGKHHGLSSKNKKIVAGVVVGVGVPFIILIIWLIYFFMLKGKKQRYIDSQGREVIDIKHNKFVRYIWCDLLGFSFKDDADQSMYNNSNSSFRNSNNLNRGGSKNSSNHMNNNLGVLGNNVMQMNDLRLEKENALLKEQREKGFPTSDNMDDKDHMDSSNSPVSLQDQSGRDIDGNFKGRNSLNTHRRMESVVTGDGFDYLDEINAKKY
ncbi:hypothetical protein ACO0OL_000622 [Hanseniaspora opuntiae]